MRSWSHTTRISAPRQRVWETLIDFEKACEWNPSVVSATVESPGEFGQGTRITTKGPSGQVKMTVEEYVPPRVLSLKVTQGMTRGTSRFVVSPDGKEGTLVEHNLQLEPGGLMLVGQVFVGSRLRNEFAGLKAWLEKA